MKIKFALIVLLSVISYQLSVAGPRITQNAAEPRRAVLHKKHVHVPGPTFVQIQPIAVETSADGQEEDVTFDLTPGTYEFFVDSGDGNGPVLSLTANIVAEDFYSYTLDANTSGSFPVLTAYIVQ